MPRTIADVITQARQVVQDVGADRHTDEKLIGYLNNAMADAFRIRRSLFLPTATFPTPPEYTASDITGATDFPIDDEFYTPFVDYVAGYVGIEDDEFAQDNRAVTLLNRFSQKLLAKGA